MNYITGLSVILASILSVTFMVLLNKLLPINDMSLNSTSIAILSASNAIWLYKLFSKQINKPEK